MNQPAPKGSHYGIAWSVPMHFAREKKPHNPFNQSGPTGWGIDESRVAGAYLSTGKRCPALNTQNRNGLNGEDTEARAKFWPLSA